MSVTEFSRPFQVHIAACMCRSAYTMARINSIVEADMFDDPIVGDVVALCIQHYKECGELLSMSSVVEAMNNESSDDVVEEMWNDDIGDVEFVIASVVDFAKQKSVETAVLQAAEQIQKGEHDGIINLMQKALMVGQDLSDIGEFVTASLDDRALDYTNPETVYRVPTGIPHLDELMMGGAEPGTLNVFLAPPKAGKSFCLVNVGYGAAKGPDGVNVVHYTLELRKRPTLRRYDKRCAGKKVNLLTEENPRQFVKQLRKRQNRLLGGDILVKYFPTRSASVSTLRAHLTHIRSLGFNPGLVIVDYADIMRAERRLGGDYRHEQASIYEDLRGLGGEFEVPVWTACQANRGALDRDIVTMKDVAESHEKSMIVDSLIAICRTEEEKAKNRGRFFTAAMREGGEGVIVECGFDLENSLVRSLNKSEPTFKKKRKKKLTKQEYLEEKAKEAEASVTRRVEDA